MKKAINLYFYNSNTKDKLDQIKLAGFDGVMLGVNRANETMTLEQEILYAQKINLEISMIHSRYIEPILDKIWDNDETGDKIIEDLINQIEHVGKFNIKNFVIHTCGSKSVKNTEIGLKRIDTLLSVCKKFNMNLCIENLYSEKQIDFIFKHIHDENLKICYDSGHNNFLTPKSKILDNFSNKIIATHLHDNHGKTDEHLVLGNGNINLKKLAKGLSKCNIEFLTAEVKFKNKVLSKQEIEIILKDTLSSLNKLEELINFYKKSK